MELATEYILGKTLTLTESIARRILIKTGGVANNRFGPDGNETLNEVMMAIEKETTQILDCLASQQQSKVDSANQYIKFAMAEFKAWNNETPPPRTQFDPYYAPVHYSTSQNPQFDDTFTRTSYQPLQISPNFSITAPTNSKYFRDAIWQLREADKWATEAFNDKKNSRAVVRIDALHIRLFCRALLAWDEKKLWFARWRQVLEPFFADRQLVRYAMGEQSFASRLFSDERAKPVAERFNQLTKCLEMLIWGMVLKDPSLAGYAREFAIFFDKNTTLAPDVKISNDWRGLRTFHLTYYDLTDDIEIKICADRLVVRLYEFKSICQSVNDTVWAIEHTGRLVSFSAREPETQCLVVNDGKKWLSIGYWKDAEKIFATSEEDRMIHIFDASSGKLIGESIDLPSGPSQSYAYDMKVTPGGSIFLKDKGNGKGYVRFADTDRWFPLMSGEYHTISQGMTKNDVIGYKMKGYHLNADVIRKISKNDHDDEAFVTETINERIYLPSEPGTCLLTVINDENIGSKDPTFREFRIVVNCEGEKQNFMIIMGAKTDNEGKSISSFPVKDVSSYDRKYMDWSMAREMIEADGKLFVLFR